MKQRELRRLGEAGPGEGVTRRGRRRRGTFGLLELWASRELVYFLTWRDVKVRYKQTLLGGAWAVLQPVLTMAVFSIFFGRLAKMPSDGIPYPVFALAGLVPWSFFAYGLTQSSASLVSNAGLLRKVYFPRLALPVSSVASGGVDFGLAFVALLGLMAWYGVPVTGRALVVPCLVALVLVASLGAGLWLSALNVKYRDVRHLLPFLAQLWMLATPVAYPSSLLPEPWRSLYGLNPMTGIVEGFRWALLGTEVPVWGLLATSGAVSGLMVSSGLVFFRRTERTFADVV
jgi:lipopolysaccharide transport system permease protein